MNTSAQNLHSINCNLFKYGNFCILMGTSYKQIELNISIDGENVENICTGWHSDYDCFMFGVLFTPNDIENTKININGEDHHFSVAERNFCIDASTFDSSYRSLFFRLLCKHKEFAGEIVKHLRPYKGSDEIYAFLDTGFICGDSYAFFAGWIFNSKANTKVEYYLIDNLSTVTLLDENEMVRFKRGDVEKAYGQKYGKFLTNCGFLVSKKVINKDVLSFNIVVATETDIFASKPLEMNRVSDPVEFAKISSSFNISEIDFLKKFENVDSLIVGDLLVKYNEFCRHHKIKVWTYGKKIASPSISLIIPLYKNTNMVEDQLCCLTKEQSNKDDVEVIYVVDDVDIVPKIEEQGEYWHRVFGISLKFVTNFQNQGFSMANNLGASIARGEYLIFMNSDVFPFTKCWEQQLKTLATQNENYGLIGTRLLYPDGTIQHDGLDFWFSDSWGVWLNKHPNQCLDSKFITNNRVNDIEEVDAVTGACFIISKKIFNDVGGFSTDFLVGDFEDSDLCFKVKHSGYKVGIARNLEIYHLERQSFSSIGDNKFATFVVKYNANVHLKKWRKNIERLKGESPLVS